MKKIFLLAMFAATVCLQAQTVSDRDRTFVQEAAMGSLLEVKLGELAQQNASSTEVKTLGHHMISDHTQSGDNLRATAQGKGIVVPTSLDAKAQQVYDKLAAKKGKAFDKAYTKCMVKDHKKDICAFKKEEKKGSDKEIRSFASTTLPVLKDHLEMSKDIRKSVRTMN